MNQAGRNTALLDIVDLRKTYRTHRRQSRRAGEVHAVDGVSLSVTAGSTVGLVGESGSGKSTLARAVPRLIEPTSGHVHFDGVDITTLRRRDLPGLRRHLQIVFQDPYAALDSLAIVSDSVGEPLLTHLGLRGAARRDRVSELFHLVGLSAEHVERYPHELSGGQLQRVAIARALATGPQLIILDEPVSSLDLSTQAQVVNLLGRLQHELGVAYLFIGHDLSVVHHVSDRIAVMYLGQIVEEGPAEAVYAKPKHPYTHALVSAVPIPDPARQRARTRLVLDGDLPAAVNPPDGCRFHPRCPYAMEICGAEPPERYDTPDGTRVHCHLHTTGPHLAGETVVTLAATHRAPAHAVQSR